jgi:hypothetical protein
MPAPQAPLPGRSFAGLLHGRPLGSDRSVVVFDEYGPVRMIRDRRYKYVHRSLQTPCEFFDLEKDPNEEQNLIEDPASQGLIKEYRARLHSWFKEHSLPEFDGSLLPVTGKGQLGRLDQGVDKEKLFSKDWRYWGAGKDGIAGKLPVEGDPW